MMPTPLVRSPRSTNLDRAGAAQRRRLAARVRGGWLTALCLASLLAATAIPVRAGSAEPPGAGSSKAGAPAGGLASELQQRSRELTGQTVPGAPGLVLGQDGWILLASELDYAASDRFWGEDAAAANPKVRPELADPVPAIVDFSRSLEALGIELLFVPVPIREHIYPESILGPARAAQSQHTDPSPSQTQFLELLEDRGVNVLDLAPILQEHRDDEHGPLFTRADAHWTGAGVVLAAERLATRISRESWYREHSRHHAVRYAAEWVEHQHRGPLLDKLETATGEHREGEPVFLRRIRTEDGASIELRNPDSPVILMGDSFTVWWQLHDASLAHQLAYELGFPVDVLSTVGGGATDTRLNLIRAFRKDPGYLDGKKVVIWCFTARDITETSKGWLLTPLTRPTPAPQ